MEDSVQRIEELEDSVTEIAGDVRAIRDEWEQLTKTHTESNHRFSALEQKIDSVHSALHTLSQERWHESRQIFHQIALGSRKLQERNIFYDRIYNLVDDPASDSVISWGKSNKSFVILNQEELIRIKMLSRFLCRTFTEFLSRLKAYGFKEIKGSSGLWEFGNKNFVRGQPGLLTEMHTRAVRERIRERYKRIKAEAEVKDGFQDLRI